MKWLMDITLLPVFGTIAVALLFDFLNGFHDAANAIATIVATGVLKPRAAVLWASFFNLVAFLFFGIHVAETIGTGLVHPALIDTQLIFCALTGAITWNLTTWWFGLPSSSSHALIGGLSGAAIIKAGIASLNMAGFAKVISAIVLSPLLGWMLGLSLMIIFTNGFFLPAASEKSRQTFRYGEFFSSALISLGHGGNDAQKTMGIIAVMLYSAGLIGSHFAVPLWVILTCNVVMALGTLSGGWRIVKTMGKEITHLEPVGGFCAETSSALTLFAATWLGIPVSTTHIVTGSIVGVGTLKGVHQVRWKVVYRIIFGWFVTLPAAGCVSALLWCMAGR